MKIEGAVAVVTGASSGIGAATALELSRRGATVVVTARRVDELERTAEACRAFAPSSLAVAADLAMPGEGERVVSRAVAALGRVDIVVNNAGISLHRSGLETTAAEVEQLMQVNFLSAVRTTMAALPGMVERGRGSVVNVTSVAGYLPNPRESAYGASKAALSRWSHGLAIDLHGAGVHVGVLSPGPIDTPIWDTDYRGRKYPPELVARAIATMIDKGIAHMTVPRRYGAVGAMYGLPLVGRVMRRGILSYERRTEPTS
jgi:short-subunit dehydrogenase